MSVVNLWHYEHNPGTTKERIPMPHRNDQWTRLYLMPVASGQTGVVQRSQANPISLGPTRGLGSRYAGDVSQSLD